MPFESLAEALLPKARRTILGLLFSHPDESWYLREIAVICNLSAGHAQRELQRLADPGVIRKFRQGRHVRFQARTECPIFEELRGIVLKTIGVGDVLRQALQPVAAAIDLAFLYGSVARGEEDARSDIDLLVVGDVALAQVVRQIRKCESQLRRPVNVTVYSAAEFRDNLAEERHFLTKVMGGEKLLLIGEAGDAAAVSEQ